MKPEELHRAHLTALVQGDIEAAAKLRKQFGAQDRGTAAGYLRAATAVCLEYRFGPGAGLGAGPVDYDRLSAFMADLRRTGGGTVPPPDFLAIEAAVRALYGESHLLEPLSEQQRGQAHYALLAFELSTHRWLRANPAHLTESARRRMITWLLG